MVRDELKFVLADLPCLLESYRVNTKPGSTAASSDGHLVKSADIGQIVVAQRLDDPAECCDPHGRFPSGLTPLTHDIVRAFDERQREKTVPREEIDRLETELITQANAGQSQSQSQAAPPPPPPPLPQQQPLPFQQPLPLPPQQQPLVLSPPPPLAPMPPLVPLTPPPLMPLPLTPQQMLSPVPPPPPPGAGGPALL